MGHWYTQDGEANHFQPNGRGTTLREARKENLLPSVTEIIGILDKPALTNWKLKQVTLAAHKNPDLVAEDEWSDFHRQVMDIGLGSDVTGVDRGSEIHDAIERWFKLEPAIEGDIFDIADAACHKIVEYCGTDKFTPEQIVVGKGYAGKVDAYSDDYVIDWKTKDIKEGQTGKQLAYPEMAMQLAAYSACLKGPGFLGPKGRRCINVFIDRTTPGLVEIHEWEPEQIETAWEKFKHLLAFWQLDKNYFPGAK